jgi:hypothetical protein
MGWMYKTYDDDDDNDDDDDGGGDDAAKVDSVCACLTYYLLFKGRALFSNCSHKFLLNGS